MCCENRAVTAELTEVLDAVVRALGGTPRAGQTEMAEAVGAALAESEHVLIQAGTGTGKSMAYLVPRSEERRVGGGYRATWAPGGYRIGYGVTRRTGSLSK